MARASVERKPHSCDQLFQYPKPDGIYSWRIIFRVSEGE
jgi:hypothetical protein